MKFLQKLSDTTAWKLLIAWVVILTVLYTTLSIVRHTHFQSGGFDLGLYDQTVWLYSRFQAPYNTVKEQFILGDHLNLTLPVIAPVLWLWNDVRALLMLQAAAVTVSLLAVYKLIRLKKFSPLTALSLSFIYSLFYGIQYGLFFDFHSVLLGVALIPWLIYFFETKKLKLFLMFLILFILTQENMGLALASLGCIYIFKKQHRVPAIMAILGGIIISLISAKVISFFSPVGFQYTPHLTLNPLLFVRELFDAPEKRQVWLYTMSSFSFLPIFSPGAMLAVIFDLAQYFTTGPAFARMWSPFMHHRAILVPYLLLGTIDVLTFLKQKKISVEIVSLLLILSVLVQQFLFHYPLNKLTKSDFWQTQSWERDNETMIQTIPADASIATQQSLIPHLSHREQIYLFWPRMHDFPEKPCGQVSCWWLDTNIHAEYLLVDLHPNEWVTMLLETTDHVGEGISTMQKVGKISLVRKIRDVSLYKINH